MLLTGLSRTTWQRGKSPGKQPPASYVALTSLLANPQPKKLHSVHFRGITRERPSWRVVVGTPLPSVFSLPPWASQRLSLHICQRGRLKLLFTGKFQGTISFQEVLQDPRRNANATYSLNSQPCWRCCCVVDRGALGRVQFRRILPKPAVLSTNVNDQLTACCQTGNVL